MGAESLLSIFGAWGVAIIFVIIALRWMEKRLVKAEGDSAQLAKDHKQEIIDLTTTHRTEILAKEGEIRAEIANRLKDALEHATSQRDALHLVETVVTLVQEMRSEQRDEPEFRRRVESLLNDIRTDTERLTLFSDDLSLLIENAKQRQRGDQPSTG